MLVLNQKYPLKIYSHNIILMRFKGKADLDDITKEKGQVNVPKI